MASEEERNEYVMMDVGAIWRGTTRYSSGMQWNFGQFEEGILDTTLDVLNSDKEYGSQIDDLIDRHHEGIRLETNLSVFKKIQKNCVILFGFLVYYQLWRTMHQIEMMLVFLREIGLVITVAVSVPPLGMAQAGFHNSFRFFVPNWKALLSSPFLSRINSLRPLLSKNSATICRD